ncbi:MAG: acyltransferase [bacterium]
MSKQRLAWLDTGRGLGAIWVMAAHFIQHFPIHSQSEPLIKNYIVLGRAGVVLFFCISGFIIPYTLFKSNLKDFIINRIFRLYPIYWFAILTLIVIESKKFDFITLLSNLLMIPGFLGVKYIIYVFWTLEVELIFYILCGIYYSKNLLNNEKFISNNIFVFLFLSFLFALLRPYLHIPAIIFLGLAVMFIGVRVYIKKSLDFKFFIIFLLSVIPISFLEKKSLFLSFMPAYFLGLSSFITLYNLQNLKANFLSFLGKISYSIYLLHLPVGIYFLNFYTLNYNVYAGVAAAVVSVILTSYLTYTFIEKKFTNIGRYIIKRYTNRELNYNCIEKEILINET